MLLAPMLVDVTFLNVQLEEEGYGGAALMMSLASQEPDAMQNDKD